MTHFWNNLQQVRSTELDWLKYVLKRSGSCACGWWNSP